MPDVPDNLSSCRICQITLMVTKYAIKFTMVINCSITLETVMYKIFKISQNIYKNFQIIHNMPDIKFHTPDILVHS